ncbi:hypothetical protein CA13_60730 [Planctomycetes bacterium CA13]|uniref:Arylsulfatase n=1 Tax=Novipirellula herctigrandis TaxID=2527986 RepID=A0A5C5ZDI1_9BACT|nr:hypothetical protein CA13_60730 [Planctomycetes bacterium CA13]
MNDKLRTNRPMVIIAGLLQVSLATAADKPNVVFIFADDRGFCG